MKIIRLQVPATRKYIPLSTWLLGVRLCQKLCDIQRRFERGNHDADGLDYTVFCLDWVINILVRYSGSEGIHPRVIDLLRMVESMDFPE